jgi:hypothetical protein
MNIFEKDLSVWIALEMGLASFWAKADLSCKAAIEIDRLRSRPSLRVASRSALGGGLNR